MKILYYTMVYFIVGSVYFAQSNVIKEGNQYYFADRIIVKYKTKPALLNKSTTSFYSKFNIESTSPTFSKTQNTPSKEEIELEKIFTLKFSSPYNPIFLAKEILRNKNIEWAEPHYLYELAYDPNDPIYNDQDTFKVEHLNVIKANAAWDINKGSEDIVIAIIDTGVDWLHEDLAANIWLNSHEIENNGIDDDENGYIDDVRGWDFGGDDGTPDNNPNEDRADHGTHVAGLSSAVTDNGIGVASIGFKSKLMPVKTSRNDLRNDLGTALIAYGYEGIKYAADNGADVINCSWGGYNKSSASQAIIDYAISKGALVVAAAGNDNSSNNFYPSSYEGVLSVGATSFVDQKPSWSNYGTKLDVTAPGVGIYSTWLNNNYVKKQGTSFASPITAGLAALVKSQFPNFTPLQIAEQIRINSDNVDEINPGYTNKLGKGRINAFKALSNITSKSVRLSKVEFIEIGDNDGIFESGESIEIKPEFTNYLNPVSNLEVNLSSSYSKVNILNNGGSVGAMNTLQTIAKSNDFLKIEILPDPATDIEVDLLLEYSDGSYSDFEWMTISINPTYQIHTTDNLAITFNSSGSIGFDDYPGNTKGGGLSYNGGPNLLFEGALVYGNSASSIMNCARDVNGDKDTDFEFVTPIVINFETGLINKLSYSKFNDLKALPKSMGIETEFYSYSLLGSENADYIIVRYALTNTKNQEINNFYIGQYYDFDMDDTSYDDDVVAFDTENNFGYVFDDDGDPVDTHIGLAFLSSDSVNYFAMDADGEDNPTVSWDGFDDNEKWIALTSGKNFSSSGPNDISVLISGGPYTLLPNEKQEFDFLIAAADNLEQLRETVNRAREKYSLLPTDVELEEPLLSTRFSLEQNYPNPFNPSTTIKYSIPANSVILSGAKNPQDFSSQSSKTVAPPNDIINVSLKVYDILGREIRTLVNEHQKPGNYQVEWNVQNLSSGIYFYQIKIDGWSDIKKMILLR